jgi:hypothetical protein
MTTAAEYREKHGNTQGRERPPCLECPDEAINICANSDPNECNLFHAFVGNGLRGRPKFKRTNKPKAIEKLGDNNG